MFVDHTSVRGYLPDPVKLPGQKPDKVFSRDLLPALSLSSGDVDLSGHSTESDQRWAGSCVGNATADALEILNSIDGLPKVQLSRLFLYSMCRTLMDADNDGKADLNQDFGTHVRLAFDVLTKFGICREDLPVEKGGWPYDLTKLYTSPSIKSMRAATAHRLHSYYRIDETGLDRCDAVIAALRGNKPVVFGTDVSKAFLAHDGADVVAPPIGLEIAGGHAMIVVGYKADKGFLVKSSWGSSWGAGGFCYMSPEYIAWERTRDLWVPTQGSAFR